MFISDDSVLKKPRIIHQYFLDLLLKLNVNGLFLCQVTLTNLFHIFCKSLMLAPSRILWNTLRHILFVRKYFCSDFCIFLLECGPLWKLGSVMCQSQRSLWKCIGSNTMQGSIYWRMRGVIFWKGREIGSEKMIKIGGKYTTIGRTIYK